MYRHRYRHTHASTSTRAASLRVCADMCVDVYIAMCLDMRVPLGGGEAKSSTVLVTYFGNGQGLRGMGYRLEIR